MEDAGEFIGKMIDAVDAELSRAVKLAERLQPVSRGAASANNSHKVRQPL